MVIIKVVMDKYNSHKAWIIKKAKSGHYTLVQRIDGVDVGSSRMGLKRIRETLHWTTV